MAVTASIGYAGDVDESDWARYAGIMGARYTIFGTTDLAPSISTTLARGVRIAAGGAGGCGVLDTCSATDVQLPVVASGSRWYLIVLKRVWGETGASQITYVNSPQSSATLPARQTNPGVEDDQPLCLARVTAGQTQVQEIRDLRVWSTNGGATARDTLVLDYLGGDVGSTLMIGDTLHVRRITAAGGVQWFSVDLVSGTINQSRLGGSVSAGTFMSSASGWTTNIDGVTSVMRQWGPFRQMILFTRKTGGGNVVFGPDGHTPDINIGRLASAHTPVIAAPAELIYRDTNGGTHTGGAYIQSDGDIQIVDGAPGTQMPPRSASGGYSALFLATFLAN